MVLGLLPGVILGTFLLAYLSLTEMRVGFYALLLPLVALQFLGVSRPLRSEGRAATVWGSGIGFLYSFTTISGPPLALFWRNQGLGQDEFRASVAQIRFAEGGFTLAAYAMAGFYTSGATSAQVLVFLPTPVTAIALGIPLGILLLRGVSKDFFSRVAMGVDIVLVTYGLTKVTSSPPLNWITPTVATGLWLVTLVGILIAGSWMLRAVPFGSTERPAPDRFRIGWPTAERPHRAVGNRQGLFPGPSVSGRNRPVGRTPRPPQ